MTTTTDPRPLTGNVLVALTVLLMAAIAVVVVFRGSDEFARPGPDGVVTVVVEGTTFTPSSLALPAGQPFSLVFENRNDFIHHLAVGRSLERDDDGAYFAEDLFAGVTARADPPEAWLPPTETAEHVTLVLPARETVRYELTLPEDRTGEWQLGCFIGRGCDARLHPEVEIVVE
ncbi:MAG: hypothetical protein WD638_04220 [Nitriliruptoraceae bacterium]